MRYWSPLYPEATAGQSYELTGVAAVGDGTVWAVGYHHETVGGVEESRTVAEYYSGADPTLSLVPTPDRETAPARDVLQDVTAVSASDVWAVGSSSPVGLPQQTLVEHWNGASWSIVASADPGAAGNELSDVDAVGPKSVWAVGSRQDTVSSDPRPLAEHWNRTGWTAVNVPTPQQCSGPARLTGVSARLSTDAWAVGWCGTGTSGDQGFAVRWDGQHWVAAGSFATFPAGSHLEAVAAVGAQSVWVAGYNSYVGSARHQALVMHYDGTSWSETPYTSKFWPDLRLNSISALPGLQPLVVGVRATFRNKGEGGRVAGGRVTPVSSFLDGTLNDVALDPTGHAWAVGESVDESTGELTGRPVVAHLIGND